MSIKKFGQDGEYHQMFNQKKIFIPPKFYFSPEKNICHFLVDPGQIFFPPTEKKVYRFRPPKPEADPNSFPKSYPNKKEE